MKTKIKILIGTIITIITCCIFLITTHAQAGYEVNTNGDIESLNLFNINNYAQGTSGNVNTTTGVVSGNDTKSVFNFQVQYITSNYNYFTIYATDITTTGIVYYTFTKTDSMYWLQFGHNGSSADIKIRYDIHELENTTYTISINIISITNPQSFNNIMLNKGQYKEYFPYGNYTNEKNAGIGQLFYQLNGTTAKFYNREITSINTILNTTPTLTETIQMNNNTMSWNSSSIPNISNRILNDSQSEDANKEMILLELKNEAIFNDLTFSRKDKNENRNIYLYNQNKELITTLTIMDSGDYNTYDITWFNNENKPIKYILFDNEKNFDIIYQINPTNAGAIYDNAYNQGYQAGYEDGIPAGIQKGINENKFQIDTTSASYIAGYTAGEQDTNILGGMVLTIVESPINIFKQIFNFNILGLDISQFIFSLLSLLLIVFLIKKIVK